MPVIPWMVNSMRSLFGRDISMVNGASMPWPMAILPVMRIGLDGLDLVLAAPGLRCSCR